MKTLLSPPWLKPVFLLNNAAAKSRLIFGARWRAGSSSITALAVLVSLVALLPLAFIIWVAVQTGWETAIALIVRRRVGELLINTVLLEACAVPASILVALTLAWLTERTDLPGGRIWSWLAVAPLAVPAYVHSYAWISVAPGLHGLFGASLVSVLAYYPFLYLPIVATLRRLDPALEESAASLGLGPWRTFFRVILPQLRLALCGGSILVGLHLLAEYGLYVMIRFDTFTTAIMDQYQSAYNGPAANMLAGVLIVCCFALMQLEAIMRGRERYARVGSGAPRRPERHPLGRGTALCLVIPLATSALSLGVPLLTLTRWLSLGGGEAWRLSEIVPALGQTLAFALAGGLLTTLAAIPMAWLSVRAPGRLQSWLETCHYHVGALPGVVTALALVTFTVRVALPLYQTVATVLMAYALMFLPRALVGLRASLAQVPIELERAAMSLGRSPVQSIRQITMRLAAPGAAASMALVAMGITTELTATLMLAPNGTTTLATRFWSLTGEIDYVAAAPYALMMIISSLPLTLLLHAHSKRTIGQ